MRPLFTNLAHSRRVGRHELRHREHGDALQLVVFQVQRPRLVVVPDFHAKLTSKRNGGNQNKRTEMNAFILSRKSTSVVNASYRQSRYLFLLYRLAFFEVIVQLDALRPFRPLCVLNNFCAPYFSLQATVSHYNQPCEGVAFTESVHLHKTICSAH